MTHRFKKLISFIFIVLFALILAEVLLRFFFGNMQTAPHQFNPGDGRCIGLIPEGAVKYTGWFRRIPTVIQDANSFGYRGNAYPRERLPDTFRIAVIGDSFVYGQGVSWDCAMPAFLEKILSEQEFGVEVLNFGIPGLNLEDSIEQYKLFARSWNPDMVLLLLMSNDLDESLCHFLKRPFFFRFFRHCYLLRTAYVFYHLHVIKHKPPGTVEQQYIRLLSSLRELKETTGNEGSEFILVVLSNPIRDNNDKLSTDLIRDIGIHAFNPGGVFWQRLADTIPLEGHLTCRGNLIMAKVISDWLVHDNLITRGKNTGRTLKN